MPRKAKLLVSTEELVQLINDKADGKTYRELGDESGIHFNTFRQIMKGTNAPSLVNAQKIENWLGVSIIDKEEIERIEWKRTPREEKMRLLALKRAKEKLLEQVEPDPRKEPDEYFIWAFSHGALKEGVTPLILSKSLGLTPHEVRKWWRKGKNISYYRLRKYAPYMSKEQFAISMAYLGRYKEIDIENAKEDLEFIYYRRLLPKEHKDYLRKEKRMRSLVLAHKAEIVEAERIEYEREHPQTADNNTLLRLLEDRGMRKSELARRIKRSTSAVTSWVQKDHIPNEENRRAVADVLEVPIEVLEGEMQ